MFVQNHCSVFLKYDLTLNSLHITLENMKTAGLPVTYCFPAVIGNLDIVIIMGCNVVTFNVHMLFMFLNLYEMVAQGKRAPRPFWSILA